MPPDAMTRPRPGPHDALEQLEVRPLEAAVPADGRDLERVDAGRQDSIDRLEDGGSRGARPPAVAHGEPVAHVERHRDPFRPVPLHEPAEQAGICERGRAQRRPGRPPASSRRVTSSSRRRPPPHSTRRRPATAATIPRHDGELLRRAGARPVEVDDVDPLGAGIGEAGRHRRRVVAVARLPVEVALPQPDHPAAAKVDRRDHLERAGNPLGARLDVAHGTIVAF